VCALVHTSLLMNAQLKKFPSDSRLEDWNFAYGFSQFLALYMILPWNGFVMRVLNLFHVACTRWLLMGSLSGVQSRWGIWMICSFLCSILAHNLFFFLG